eukprot:CAMPEP_0174386152 /NCGR_PEP_ID=MMETSP0811_2-20130205/127086_1 /TAXON_ID=73025 ORGANISM="Eutreptiella gymnastica-like, Strain CCMP1594" /NCGR_SAMPLE_ID=MMETSP0811_2 /ASSEMBLY_ACC=CAM_ASM_000667 /LENGTH=64 /DNA_ID=CAMNT_0015540727 /DNA_START=1035 /DNA_END=1229 /DNA_ORIENTATION=-
MTSSCGDNRNNNGPTAIPMANISQGSSTFGILWLTLCFLEEGSVKRGDPVILPVLGPCFLRSEL